MTFWPRMTQTGCLPDDSAAGRAARIKTKVGNHSLLSEVRRDSLPDTGSAVGPLRMELGYVNGENRSQ